MKKVFCVLLIFTSLISFSQSSVVKNFQKEIDEWKNYSFTKFVLDQDQRNIIGYSNGIVSGVFPLWNVYSKSREYKIVETPILPNGEYGRTVFKFQTLNKDYSEVDLENYVTTKIENIKSSIDSQLDLEKQEKLRRERLNEIQRKKAEFISLKKPEIEKISNDFKSYNDSIVLSLESRYNKIVMSLEDISQISNSLLSYYKILYDTYNTFSSEQYNLLNSKYLLGYFEKGLDYGKSFSQNDNEFVIIQGRKINPLTENVNMIDRKNIKFPQVTFSQSKLNWYSLMNKYLDLNNGEILYEFAVFNELVTQRDKNLRNTRSFNLESAKNDIIFLSDTWKKSQIDNLEKEVFNFKVEKLPQEVVTIKELERVLSIYEDKIVETGFLTRNLDLTQKFLDLKDLSKKYSKYVSFYNDQFYPLSMDLRNLVEYGSYTKYINSNKIDKVIKSLNKDLGLSTIIINDYKLVGQYVTQGFSFDDKLNLSNDFINRIDSNPINFPVSDIKGLKIFN